MVGREAEGRLTIAQMRFDVERVLAVERTNA